MADCILVEADGGYRCEVCGRSLRLKARRNCTGSIEDVLRSRCPPEFLATALTRLARCRRCESFTGAGCRHLKGCDGPRLWLAGLAGRLPRRRGR